MNRPARPGCPRVEQAVGLVLHTLEPDEELQVLAHLPGCPDCTAAVRDAEDALATLGSSVDQVDPPPRLRESILDAAARTPQIGPPPNPAPAPPAPAPGRRPAPSRTAAPTRPPTGGGHRAPRRRTRTLVAAALALIVAAGIGGLAARTVQLQNQRDAQIQQTQTIVDMVAQFDRPGVRHAWLTAEPGQSPVAAVMVDGATRAVVTVGLPTNSAADDTYVLWGMGDGDPRALGTFDVTSAQTGPHDIGSGTATVDYAGYAISLEPGRALPAVPTNVVATGQVEI
ncbi:hypothetical protein PSU4_18290 [Pseudonocardia sulfidoxydans NBRC 16205]|uniref:Regulator of SigK n=1 Tax=Pseudonocardia sulfidoxydans NBRC 16205 TaxID=1223511 RepID=A0A511DDI7_9PSEU|nr:anti-sigma factor [Pseudonocardia sulfidoxydans]GEL22875.1 hypothetical protein PSU4_18290 [Pseudonocardia sulfidoxydans NBRC 16205]